MQVPPEGSGAPSAAGGRLAAGGAGSTGDAGLFGMAGTCPCGTGGTAGSDGNDGGSGAGRAGAQGGSGDAEAGAAAESPIGGEAGAGLGGQVASAGSGASLAGAGGATAGSSGDSAGGASGGDAAVLPVDLPNTPVTGALTVSTNAVWEVDGTFLPTFEIHTPSASYWLVKSLGMIVSLVDSVPGGQRQWLNFSSGFRPLRGLPSYGTFDGPETMTTTVDVDSQTSTHLRLLSVSDTASWRLVWDFYPTHVTLTVNAAPVPYGIAYRGVPGGGSLDTARFVLADGTEQSALTSSVTDWAGPAEWAYLSDRTLGRSLFAIHHADDSITDRYEVKDNDSAMISFGDGNLAGLPQRFSFGVIASSDDRTVKDRVDFVIGAIR
jgi:hypothetical protein